MKWIGQHIWDFISRFRNDVYFEDLDPSNNTRVLVVDDTTGKVSYNTDAGGGGINTENIETTGDGVDDMDDVTKITFSGNHVQTFDQGSGNLLVNIGDPISGALGFAIASGGYFVNAFDEYNISNPVDEVGKLFHKGTASNPIAVTDSTSFTFSTTSARSKMGPINGGNPKIEVTIRGANSNDSTGDNQVLGSTIHEVDGNATTTDTSTGITIQISSYEQDTIIDTDSRKAVVSVTWDPSVLAGDHIVSNASGSQLYESISIKHTDNSGSTIPGSTTFTSPEKFFFDGSKVTPTYSGNPTISIQNTNSTKLLSNILYYYNSGGASNGVGWYGAQDGIANFARDTYPISTVHGTIKFDFPNNFQNDNTTDATISSHTFTNNENGTFSKTLYLTSGMIGVNKTITFNVESIVGGFSADAGADSNVATTSAANYLSRNSGNTNTAEYFYNETYRIPNESVVDCNTNSADLETLEDNSMGGGKLLASGKDHLVQTWNSMSSFKLRHPNDMPTVANLPVQTLWTGSAPSDGTYVEYYRYFSYNSSATSRVWDLGMTRSQYLSNYDNDLMEIWISRPGNSSYHDFIKMNPASTYNFNNNTNSCYAGSQPATTSHFKAQFSGSSSLYIMKIIMKSASYVGTNSGTMAGVVSKIVSI